jgi:hypothetical protein
LNDLKKPTFPLLPLGSGVEAVTRDPNNPNFNADNTGDWVTDTDATFTEWRNNHCRDEYISYNNPTNTPTPTGITTEFLNWIEDPRVVDYTGDPNTNVFYCFTTFTKYSYTAGNTFYTKATNGVDQTSNNLVYTNVALGTTTWQNIVGTLLVNCTEVGSGETYKCDRDLIYNYMSLNYKDQRSKFTPGQKQRIRECLLHNLVNIYNDLQYALALNEDGTTNTSVLFEPYSSMDVGGNIVRTTDNGNGTANVCRARLREHKFQPGFDYTFPDNYDTDPITVGKYDFPVPPVRLQTGDYPITIAQLGTAPTNTGIVKIVCTKGVICIDETINRGTLYSMQVLGSMNITVEELDAIEVKDPELYNNLMSQYYYILKKETISGAKLQEVFYKN